MRPHDELCDAALLYRGIANRIRALERRQEGGEIAPEVQRKIDWWLRLAEEAQREHEAQGESQP